MFSNAVLLFLLPALNDISKGGGGGGGGGHSPLFKAESAPKENGNSSLNGFPTGGDNKPFNFFLLMCKEQILHN